MKKWLYLFFTVCLFINLLLIKSIFQAYKSRRKNLPKTQKAVKGNFTRVSNSFVIKSQNRRIYIVILKDGEVQTRNAKLSPKIKRRILKMIKRCGLKDVICYKIAGRRFSCIFPNADNREALLNLKCDVLIVAEKKEKVLYPISIMDIPKRWQESWNNFKDTATLKELYHPHLYKILEERLKRVKYVDVMIFNPSIFKLPSSDLYIIVFKGIFRTNLTRKEGNFALVVNSGRIVQEITP